MLTKNRESAGFERVRAIALDVDGVLTDGGVWWGPDGMEWKRFSFSDIMGLSLARRAGFVLALISGEDSPLVDRYAKKLLIRNVVKGCRDKAAALREFASTADLDLSEICFVGDDINDLLAMQIAGISVAPADANPSVLSQVDFISTKLGGQGAVRELVDAMLDAHGLQVQEVLSRP